MTAREREVEELLLHLRGLVFVRAILEQRGAREAELAQPRVGDHPRAQPTSRGRRRSCAVDRSRLTRAPRYTVAPRGCGGIGRRARFRSVWGQPRGGSSPLIRIAKGTALHSPSGLNYVVSLITVLDPGATVESRLPPLNGGRALRSVLGHPAHSPSLHLSPRRNRSPLRTSCVL